ncbi:MAG TPA: hypothetical protein VHB48_16385 [Chitinophagaceae bacterium]|nr:hypothetical protein [Chitinophagaceae bacterium]
MKLRFLLTFCMFLLCLISFSQYESSGTQFRGGLQLSGLQLPSSVGNYGMSFGPGIDFAWSPEDSRAEVYFNGTYFLPSRSVTTDQVYLGSSSAEATLTQKTSILALGVGGRYFFMDRTENNFNAYATITVSYLFANTKATYTNVPNGYAPYYGDQTSGKSNQAMVNAGVGMEYLVSDGGSVFAEACYRFPATSYNSRTGYAEEVQIVAHPWFSLGYRFSIGGGGW